MQFLIARKNPKSGAGLQVCDAEGVPVSYLIADVMGASTPASRQRILEWVKRACEQYAIVNPDDPFPLGPTPT